MKAITVSRHPDGDVLLRVGADKGNAIVKLQPLEAHAVALAITAIAGRKQESTTVIIGEEPQG